MNQKVKWLFSIIVLLMVGALLYGFLFGKLFPYSPVVVGFSKHELSNTKIYVQKGAEFTDFEKIDSLLPEVEQFHEWPFLKKPRIFIFKDNRSFYQRSSSRARFCAFFNGDIIISPWAMKEAEAGDISLEIYLKHELSHSLLHQHSGLVKAIRYPRWLLEGIAVYSTHQMGTSWYPSKEETYQYIRNGNFMPPEYFKTKKEKEISLDVKYPITFMYSEFGCMVDYLVETYGKEKFVFYMKELTKDSNPHSVFQRIYLVAFDEYVRNFKKSITDQS